MPLNHQALRREFEAAERDVRAGKQNQFMVNLREGLEKGHLKPDDFSIRQLFENFVPDGRELVASFNPRYGGDGVQLLEGSAVNTSNFSNITGQIVYSKVMEAYNAPEFIGDRLVTTVPTSFDGEKIPGIGQIGDEAETIAEGHPYPTAGISEEWVETPSTIKRGFIVPVTKEAVFFDRTGLVLKRAGDVSTWIRTNKEKRILDLVLGITTAYRRNGGAAVATYGDNSGSHDWDNLAASNALVDWTDVENALLLFDGMVDPMTGEPIVLTPNQVIVPSALKLTAKRILNATQVLFGPGGGTNATDQVTVSGNPLSGQEFEVLSSAYVKARTSSASTWFIGDFKKGFAYMENWPVTVTQAPANSEAEFTHDIVSRFKVSERGAAAVLDPRCAVKCTA